jgi:S-adenosylmethionine synthetase
MSRGYSVCSPVVIINMGVEMIYILDQRLKAQNIDIVKARKVLNDVVRTMFAASFVDQLFDSQKMFSVQFTRQIFDKVAHSSIMKLNETSMNKVLQPLTPAVTN